jgi:hypothetical protein
MQNGGNKMQTQYAYAKLKGVSRSYICRLVKDGRIILINGKVDPEQADEVLDEIWYPRRKDNTIRFLIELALQNFAYFAGQNTLESNHLSELAEKFMKHDKFNEQLTRFGHPGLDSYEVQFNGEWTPVDFTKFL